MQNTYVLAIAATIAVTLYGSTARAEEPPDPNAEKRLHVQHAEEEQMLDERMARLEARRKDSGHGVNDHEHESALWGHRGRIVVPSVIGVGSNDAHSFGAYNPFASSSIVSVTKIDGGLDSSTTFALRPNVDWFFTDHWSLGVEGLVSSESADSGRSGFAVGAMPRIGRTFEVGPVTLWSRLGAGYGERHQAFDPPGSAASLGALGGVTTLSNHAYTLTARADLDIVVPLMKYVVFTAGPRLTYAHVVERSSFVDIDPANTVTFGVHGSLGLNF